MDFFDLVRWKDLGRLRASQTVVNQDPAPKGAFVLFLRQLLSLKENWGYKKKIARALRQ